MSEVQTLKVEVTVTKEATEVFEAVAGIIADIKAGKGVTEIALGNLNSLKEAVEGFDMLDDELKHSQFPETSALGSVKVGKALLAKKA